MRVSKKSGHRRPNRKQSRRKQSRRKQSRRKQRHSHSKSSYKYRSNLSELFDKVSVEDPETPAGLLHPAPRLQPRPLTPINLESDMYLSYDNVLKIHNVNPNLLERIKTVLSNPRARIEGTSEDQQENNTQILYVHRPRMFINELQLRNYLGDENHSTVEGTEHYRILDPTNPRGPPLS
jgi:hypothetical protein